MSSWKQLRQSNQSKSISLRKIFDLRLSREATLVLLYVIKHREEQEDYPDSLQIREQLSLSERHLESVWRELVRKGVYFPEKVKFSQVDWAQIEGSNRTDSLPKVADKIPGISTLLSQFKNIHLQYLGKYPKLGSSAHSEMRGLCRKHSAKVVDECMDKFFGVQVRKTATLVDKRIGISDYREYLRRTDKQKPDGLARV